MILAGDIGGTKCKLGLFEHSAGGLRSLRQQRFESKEYAGVEEVVREFVRQAGGPIRAAAFGVAGPVVENRVEVTNLPWVVDGAKLAPLLGIERVVLLNDLEATGHALARLAPADLHALNQGRREPRANRAILAPGTGLGEAILFWDGVRHLPSATEGGHADFAPRTEEEIELLRFLQRTHRRVSFEMVLSGRAFETIHAFLDPGVRHPGFGDPERDAAPEITARALDGSCPVCARTLEMWVGILGAEAGNLALKSLARGGVYLAGGIAAKHCEKLAEGGFLRAFTDKARFGDLLAQVPVEVILNEDAPLLGAAARAAAEV